MKSGDSSILHFTFWTCMFCYTSFSDTIAILTLSVVYFFPPVRLPCFSSLYHEFKRCSKKKNVANDVDRVKLQGAMTLWPVQKQTAQHETRKTTRRNRHLEQTIVFSIYCLYFVNWYHVQVNFTVHIMPLEKL